MQLLFSGARPGRDDFRGVTAVLGILDVDTGEVIHRCEYATPAKFQAPKQKMQFTGFALQDDQLFACCHNEIVYFDAWPPTEPAGRVSIPGFNDLHHCLPWQGGLAVANTGLETVDHVSLGGELLARWDLLDGFEGARKIDPDVDYRLLDDTKPHLVHGDHLFSRKGELWVTELRASRAVPVIGGDARIDFEMGMPHDGRYIDDRLVFTTTNGRVAVVDPESLAVVESHDLGLVTPDVEILGWCRGVCEDTRVPGRYFVAFSFARDTRWEEYAFWIKHRQKPQPSRIALYDFNRGELVESFRMVTGQDLILFQLHPLPQHLWV